jgi:hypothetical protein
LSRSAIELFEKPSLRPDRLSEELPDACSGATEVLEMYRVVSHVDIPWAKAVEFELYYWKEGGRKR